MVDRFLLNYPKIRLFGRITHILALIIFVMGYVALIPLAITQKNVGSNQFWSIWWLTVFIALLRLLLHYRRKLACWITIFVLWMLSTFFFAIFLGTQNSTGIWSVIGGFAFFLYPASYLSLLSALVWKTIYHDVSQLYLSLWGLFSTPLLWIRLKQSGGVIELLTTSENSLLDPTMSALVCTLPLAFLAFCIHIPLLIWRETQRASI